MADPWMVESVGIQIRRRGHSAPVQLELLDVTVVPRLEPEQPGRLAVSSVEAPPAAGLHSIWAASFVLGPSHDNPYDPATIDVQEVLSINAVTAERFEPAGGRTTLLASADCWVSPASYLAC
jgi:hypothetical protein